jgi:hypothetical protein
MFTPYLSLPCLRLVGTGIPYIGWTEPGEWLNYTVKVKQSGVYSVRLLHTSNRGGAISLSVDGQDAIGAIPIRSTYRDDDDVDWRHWHHWDIADPIAELTLEAGVHLLTLHTVEQGNSLVRNKTAKHGKTLFKLSFVGICSTESVFLF